MNCFSGGQFCREAGLFFCALMRQEVAIKSNVVSLKEHWLYLHQVLILGRNDTNTFFIMEAEKIICCDGARNNDALAWAAMANKGNDPMAMAAMMNGGMNNQWNNPFVYLVWMMVARKMWGDDGSKVQDAEIQGQLNAIRSQMADNQNSNLLMDAIKGNNNAIDRLAGNLNCDFNTLNSAICDVRGGIDRLSGQVGYSAERVINAVNLGDMNIVQQLKDCCCQTQQNIIKMGYESQLGQKDIVNQMQQGFSYTNTGIERAASNLGFQISQMVCDLKTNGNSNTQRIIDTMNSHWNQDLQQKYNDAKLELSQQKLIAALGTKTTTATT